MATLCYCEIDRKSSPRPPSSSHLTGGAGGRVSFVVVPAGGNLVVTSLHRQRFARKSRDFMNLYLDPTVTCGNVYAKRKLRKLRKQHRHPWAGKQYD